MAINRRGAAAFGCAVVALLVTAPTALAARVNYMVPPSPAYTLQDNGSGIVKLTYNGCITATSRVELDFALVTNVNKSAPATLKVLKAEGEEPTVTFTPAVLNLVAGPDQSFDVGLAFTINNANNGVTTFRIKLDADIGTGLGEGPGIMVRIPCVLLAPPAPILPGAAPVAPGAALAAPTAGVFPTIGSSQASARARCISTPQTLRLRAGERTRVAVSVIANGQLIRGARVRATYPGAQFTKTTGADGRVIFNIRPNRSGRLVLQSDVCFGAQRFAVRTARVVTRQQPARVTG